MPADLLPAQLREAFTNTTCLRLVLSEHRRDVSREIAKVTVRPVVLRGVKVWQFTLQRADRAIHENHSTRDALHRITELLDTTFLQATLSTTEADWSLRAPRGSQSEWKVRQTNRKPAAKPVAVPAAHDRGKNYLIPEGVPCPFLQEMGVMTDTGEVRRSMYPKFRQVNRFLELVHDVVHEFPTDRPLRVIDFGCGKSYLTFALHHLLTTIEQRTVEITGLDLKTDVIEQCRSVADRLGCDGLKFEQGAIAGFAVEGPIDLVVSLHACDTATDDALAQAIAWRAKAILAVPCCQHELAPQLASDALTPLLRHGILRERFAALATDALRALVLEIEGYATQVVEFIDLEHTPKNLLLRAVCREMTPAGLLADRAGELANYKQALGVTSTHLESRLSR